MKTLLLDLTNWDLVLDTSGNIAVATDPYSVAQDVASACRTFLGEVYYDTTLGIPYFQQVLGKAPPLSFLKAQLVAAASTVPGCTNPVCFIEAVNDRGITGQIQFTDSDGGLQITGFGAAPTPQTQLFDSAGNLISDSSGDPLFGSLT